MPTEKKGSCVKRAALGCGGLIALFILLGAISAIVGYATQPKDADFAEFKSSSSLAKILEPSQMLGGEQPPVNPKPLKIVIDAEMVDLRIKPNLEGSDIRIESSYDQANYELKTDLKEKGEHLEYGLSFTSNTTPMGMLMKSLADGEKDTEIHNTVTLYLPKNVLLAMEYEFKMGNFEVDATGLALHQFTGQSQMGEITVSADEPNQVPLTELNMQHKMGAMTIQTAENLRYSNARLKGRMGDMRITHNGAYHNDAAMNIQMSMGSVQVYEPINTNLEQRSSVFMGESRRPEEKEHQANLPTLSLNGKVTMGEFRIVENSQEARYRRDLYRNIRRAETLEEVNALLAEHRTLIEGNPSFAIDEDELNRQAYRYLVRDQYDKALILFKLNTELNPDYANGYDSLGECYYEMGRLDDAIAAYQKAVDLAPGQYSGEILKRLLKEKRNAGDQTGTPEATEEGGNTQGKTAVN